MKKTTTYFKKHLIYNSIIHFIGGMGIGVLIALPIASPHTVRWALALIAISILGHLYAYFA